MEYRRTQIGKLILGFTLLVAAAIIIFYGNIVESDANGDLIAFSTLSLFGILAALFYKLEVVVNNQEIVLKFGIGLIKKRIPISTIKDVQPVRNSFWYGWGIRLTPHGWLWNIAGYEAVELTFHDKTKKFRIGCANNKELSENIKSRL